MSGGRKPYATLDDGGYIEERAQALRNKRLGRKDDRPKGHVPGVSGAWNDYRPKPKDYRMPIQADPRFPSANKKKWCQMLYVDYHRCLRKYGPDHQDCNYYYTGYQSVCPTMYYKKWDEQREANLFPCEHMIMRQKLGDWYKDYPHKE